MESMIADGLKPEIKAKIIRLCKAIIPSAEIWLYGSRARGDFSDISDIDLALDAGVPIDYILLGELKDILAVANIYHRFDIVDLQSLPESNFKSVIQKEKILWQK